MPKRMITITRRLEFDAGHRIARHESKCRHPHGHRYALEVTCQSPRLDECGRVIDFAKIKEVVGNWLEDNLDHAFLVDERDDVMLAMLRAGEHGIAFRHFRLPGEPTAENLARLLLAKCRELLSPLQIMVVRVRLYETPNCWADAS
jgi:6-pyruvoyltetrahydropterin/6-carboxytetrahydropterin synthase